MDHIPGGQAVLAVVGVLALQALWMVPEGPEEKGVVEGTGWSARGLGGTGGSEPSGAGAEEGVGTWAEARALFCEALWEAEWLERLGRVGRLLPVSEGAVLGVALVLLVVSLTAQQRRVLAGTWVMEVAVEWVVHVSMVVAVGAPYLAAFGVFQALRRLQGRRATVLALVVVARVAFPVLCPLFCLDGGADWVRATWEAVRGRFL